MIALIEYLTYTGNAQVNEHAREFAKMNWWLLSLNTGLRTFNHEKNLDRNT